jgi:hypothetical protein
MSRARTRRGITLLHGVQKRYDLGKAALEDDAGAICLKTARNRAFKIRAMCDAGISPLKQLEAWAIGITVEKVEALDAEKPKQSWEWTDAIAKFVAWNIEHRRKDTADDYRQKLADTPELAKFRGRQVNLITRNELMEAVEKINGRGKWSTACGCRRVLSRFFNWLAEAARQDQTNVSENLMLNTKDPERPKNETGMNDHKRTSDYYDEEEHGDAPPPIELGRALAIARSGALPERTGLGIQLLLGTLQRRRAVIGANRWRFKQLSEFDSEQIWLVPPYFRKSGSKRGSRSHLVPCVSWVAGVVERLDRLIGDDNNPFLFPSSRAHQEGEDYQHADIEMLNKALETMPGVSFSTHGGRYAFSTYGERDLGFAKSEGKVILDHLEGVDAKDVTGNFYSSDPQIKRKREMMLLWTQWLDQQAAIAISADRMLLDVNHTREEIYKKRYGEDKLAKRIAYREARGWPIWSPDGEQEAAE